MALSLVLNPNIVQILKIEIIEMDGLSGSGTKIYSFIVNDANESLYEEFVRENIKLFKKEVTNLDSRLEVVGNETGMEDEFYKTGIGKPLIHHICEFKDKPKANLRLFFIEEVQNNLIMLGSGGQKPKEKHAIQEVPLLDQKRVQLMEIEDLLRSAEKKGHFIINSDGTINSTTNFVYDTNDYE